MSATTWREINPNFRVDHDHHYTFADVERWKGDVRASHDAFYSNPECRTAETADDILDILYGYSEEIHRLMTIPCGITVEKLSYGDGKTIRIYQQERRGGHMLFCAPGMTMPGWLFRVLSESTPIQTSLTPRKRSQASGSRRSSPLQYLDTGHLTNLIRRKTLLPSTTGSFGKQSPKHTLPN